MSKTSTGPGVSRKLYATEYDRYRDHLLRLDKDSRRMRFGMLASDDFIRDYTARLHDMKSIVYAYLVDGEVRAEAELRPLGFRVQREAEAAFSVEAEWQVSGIGTELIGRVVRAARNRSITRVYMNCLAENRKMQAVARKFEAILHFDHGDVVGEVAPTHAHYFSIWREAVEDELGFVMAVLDLQKRFLPAA